VTGHSLAARVLLDDLVQLHEVDVIDLGRESRHTGALTPGRMLAVAKLLLEIAVKRSRVDAAYLTISESVAGNIKDLCIYSLLSGRLSRVCVHLHGGSIKRLLFDRHPVLRHVNSFFLRRVGAIIVTGPSHRPIFAEEAAPSALHIVPNFAQDALFVSDDDVTVKFQRMTPLRIIYVSGMSKDKGYEDLLDAFLRLTPYERSRVRIDFAGRFDSPRHEADFRARISNDVELRYHGVVDGERKVRLFSEAHVFCLPTAMFEGQPISILEAYASGCVVLTTRQTGILDIFSPGTNGIAINPGDPSSIVAAIRSMLQGPGRLADVARFNRCEAVAKFRTANYATRIRAIIEDITVKALRPARRSKTAHEQPG
jgi:glycosyltransferase involved in cell wall biosynthesis